MDEIVGAASTPSPDDAPCPDVPCTPAAGSELRNRLPRLSPANAEALRAFFGAPLRVQLADGSELHLAPASGPGPGDVVQVEGDGVRVALQLDGADAPASGGLRWSDYAGRARTLAWSLAHEGRLMRLSDGLGIALLPISVEAGQVADDEDCTWLAFSIGSGGPDATDAPPACSGRLRFPSAWLHRLHARAASSSVDEPLPPLHRWLDLPASVSIRLGGPVLSADTWRALRPTDVIIAGRRGRPATVEAVFEDKAWPVGAAAGCWRVEGPARPAAEPIPKSFHAEISTMNSTPSVPGEGDDSAARSLPVRVEFELGQVKISLGELAALQPGYVFNLPAHLEGANVVVRANGRPAGRGEVVAVGDTLGVRLLSWS